jgi:hypothetical protein
MIIAPGEADPAGGSCAAKSQQFMLRADCNIVCLLREAGPIAPEHFQAER